MLTRTGKAWIAPVQFYWQISFDIYRKEKLEPFTSPGRDLCGHQCKPWRSEKYRPVCVQREIQEWCRWFFGLIWFYCLDWPPERLSATLSLLIVVVADYLDTERRSSMLPSMRGGSRSGEGCCPGGGRWEKTHLRTLFAPNLVNIDKHHHKNHQEPHQRGRYLGGREWQALAIAWRSRLQCNGSWRWRKNHNWSSHHGGCNAVGDGGGIETSPQAKRHELSLQVTF